jgi:hypothetical protein
MQSASYASPLLNRFSADICIYHLQENGSATEL